MGSKGKPEILQNIFINSWVTTYDAIFGHFYHGFSILTLQTFTFFRIFGEFESLEKGGEKQKVPGEFFWNFYHGVHMELHFTNHGQKMFITA